MEVIELTPKSDQDNQSLVVVIEDFDGMHKGHEAILKGARGQLEDEDMFAVLHVSSDEEGEKESHVHKKITPFNEILSHLEKYGVQRVYHIRVSEEMTDDQKKDGLQETLSKLKIKQVIVGQDAFIHQLGFSNTQSLNNFFSKRKVDVTPAPEITENGQPIETQRIRRFIEAGRMEAAQSLLGRPYTITGIVVHGQKLGRKLGFPTLNLGNVEAYVYPKPGVYLGVVGIHNDEGRITEYWNVLISTGYRPTVNGTSYLIEAYILNYSGDLYDRKVSVSFLRYMRGEIKFEGLDPLIEQMEQDKREAEALFGIRKDLV